MDVNEPVRAWLLVLLALLGACDADAAAAGDAGPDVIDDAGVNVTALCRDKCAAKLRVPCNRDSMDGCMAVCVSGNTGPCGAPATALDRCLVGHAEPWFCFLSEVAIKQELCRMEQDQLYDCQIRL